MQITKAEVTPVELALKQPVRITYYIILTIVALLVVFCAVWFGMYLSKGITVPIMELAEGTRRVAGGDLTYHIKVVADDESSMQLAWVGDRYFRVRREVVAGLPDSEELVLDDPDDAARRMRLASVLIALGEPDGSKSDRATALSEALRAAGFKAPVRPKIRDEIWIKLWGNLAFNPLSARTGETLDERVSELLPTEMRSCLTGPTLPIRLRAVRARYPRLTPPGRRPQSAPAL